MNVWKKKKKNLKKKGIKKMVRSESKKHVYRELEGQGGGAKKFTQKVRRIKFCDWEVDLTQHDST